MESVFPERRSVYPALAALLGDDICRVRYMVSNDLRQMEHAAVADRWAQVRQLAHRTALGCRFIGEERAAAASAAVEHAQQDAGDSLARTFGSAHGALVAVLERAAACAGVHAKVRTE
jgi:HPt (histidine-containing phosphotransfer) domain-containing protein